MGLAQRKSTGPELKGFYGNEFANNPSQGK